MITLQHSQTEHLFSAIFRLWGKIKSQNKRYSVLNSKTVCYASYLALRLIFFINCNENLIKYYSDFNSDL